MNKSSLKKSQYVCNVCGELFNSWSGRCPNCMSWSSLDEVSIKASNNRSTQLDKMVINSLIDSVQVDEQRILTNISDIDQVLGGGFVRSSAVLISGEPGMGKSTLLLQVAGYVAEGNKVLYISGEESLSQLAMRVKRLLISSNNLNLAISNSLEQVLDIIDSNSYDLVIVDSIQTLSSSVLTSASGSIAQTAYCSYELSSAIKKSSSALIIVGQVTKDGSIAGPKNMEHIVDVVITLEGDPTGGLKIMKSTKNRYGSINEIAIFEMHNNGLEIVKKPSLTLLNGRKITDGSVVFGSIEGSRPILVEIQALTNRTIFGYPKRAASGIDLNRLNVLIAMLERRANIKLSGNDVYVNLVGGLKITEPASDLAIAMAVISAYKAKSIKENVVFFGELGLSGELRSVSFMDRRINEANQLNFSKVIGPKIVKHSSNNKDDIPTNYIALTDINQVINYCFS